jgi:hypothetical protein
MEETMPRPGLLLQLAARQEAAGAVPCECGHPQGEHHELPAVLYSLDDDVIVETPNPDYKPGHFHCDYDDCACVRVEVFNA